MSTENLTIAFTVNSTPEEVYAAITNVRGWWSGEIDGRTDELGTEFTYRYEDVHRSTQRISELIPGKRVAWHVVDGYLAFVEDQAEWTGTDIIFDIAQQGDAGTEVRFTHVGLASDNECFDSCSTAWRFYVGTSLRNLITTGQGAATPQQALSAPQPRGDPAAAAQQATHAHQACRKPAAVPVASPVPSTAASTVGPAERPTARAGGPRGYGRDGPDASVGHA